MLIQSPLKLQQGRRPGEPAAKGGQKHLHTGPDAAGGGGFGQGDGNGRG